MGNRSVGLGESEKILRTGSKGVNVVLHCTSTNRFTLHTEGQHAEDGYPIYEGQRELFAIAPDTTIYAGSVEGPTSVQYLRTGENKLKGSGYWVPDNPESKVVRIGDEFGDVVDPTNISSVGGDSVATSEWTGGTAEEPSTGMAIGQRQNVDVYLDLSAVNADYQFEVKHEGGTWRTHTTVGQGSLSTGGEFFQFETAYPEVRSSYQGADADVTENDLAAGGL